MAQNGIANRNDGSSPPLQASAASSFLEQSGATSESTPRSEVQVRQMAFETQLASISALRAEIESIRLEVGEQEAKVEQKKREHREWWQKVKKLDLSFEVGKANKKHFEEALIGNEKAIEKIESMRVGHHSMIEYLNGEIARISPWAKWADVEANQRKALVAWH